MNVTRLEGSAPPTRGGATVAARPGGGSVMVAAPGNKGGKRNPASSMRSSAWVLVFSGIFLFWASAGPTTAEPVDVADLQGHVARLADRVEELAGTHGLLDTLHFGWFDRPYARATLAVLVKTTSALRREARLRRRGNGAIADASVRAMLAWSDTALAGVLESQTDPEFRPHRLRVTDADVRDASATSALFGFVDRATSTRLHTTFGDLDLAAAMGFRIYPRLDLELSREDAGALCAARANALGMATIVVEASPVAANRSPSRPTTSLSIEENSIGQALVIRPVSLRELLEHVSDSTGRSKRSVAIVDPPFGESFASSLARRALARGTLGGKRYVAADWTSPIVPDVGQVSTGSAAAAMWVHAIDGQSLGLLPGWRDLRDGSASPYPSILTNPALMETMAHTALDLIRLGRYLAPLRVGPSLVVTVGPDAIHLKDANRWARWIEPVWSALHNRQIRFDVAGPAVTSAELDRRYPVVLTVRRDQVHDLSSLLMGIEREFAKQPGHPQRVTAHELDERLAADIFIQGGQTQDGRPCLAVVNLSDRPRSLLLRGPARPGTTVDVVSGERIADSQTPLALSPWQVRVLRPANQP